MKGKGKTRTTLTEGRKKMEVLRRLDGEEEKCVMLIGFLVNLVFLYSLSFCHLRVLMMIWTENPF